MKWYTTEIRIADEPEDIYLSTLQREADRLQLALQELLELIIVREAQRLAHIERSKPKPKAEPRPVGRPPVSSAERQLRELVHHLDGVYGKLRLLYTDAYDAIYKEQEAQYRQMVENKDVVGLALFVKEQPWQKRR